MFDVFNMKNRTCGFWFDNINAIQLAHRICLSLCHYKYTL